MLFRPARDLGWDTWVVPGGDGYLLFYIRISEGGPRTTLRPTIGEGWDGVSVATSSDLLHWRELGAVLEVAEDAAWIGTGMIHRVGDRYVMNFSEERPVGNQVIGFAESADLLSWSRMPRRLILRPDGRLYQCRPEESADPLPRWDSLGITQRPDGTYLAFICANTTRSLPGQCGTLGLLRSDDGLSWNQLPPAIEPGLYPSYEVPEHVEFDGRHYVLFSTNTSAGPRFDPAADSAHSGTYYVVADAVDGPYRRPDGELMLLGSRDRSQMFGTYVGRPLRLDSSVLMYHQWTATYPEGWVGTPKVLSERRPGQLQLTYWEGCEALKGATLFDGRRAPRFSIVPTAGAVPVVDWQSSADSVVATDRGGTSAIELPVGDHRESDGYVDLADGRIVEVGIRVDSGRGLGIWFGSREVAARTGVLLNVETGRVEFGRLVDEPMGASARFEPSEWRAWTLRHGERVTVRALVRRRFLEVYLDDKLVHCQILPASLDPARIGLFAELASGALLAPTVWAMA